MATSELMIDRDATYEALLRLIQGGRTNGQAFRKLVDRLDITNRELISRGAIGEGMNDAGMIRDAH